MGYDTQMVDYDLICATLDDINLANIINPVNVLDALSYFTTVFLRFKRSLTNLYL